MIKNVNEWEGSANMNFRQSIRMKKKHIKVIYLTSPLINDEVNSFYWHSSEISAKKKKRARAVKSINECMCTLDKNTTKEKRQGQK